METLTRRAAQRPVVKQPAALQEVVHRALPGPTERSKLARASAGEERRYGVWGGGRPWLRGLAAQRSARGTPVMAPAAALHHRAAAWNRRAANATAGAGVTCKTSRR